MNGASEFCKLCAQTFLACTCFNDHCTCFSGNVVDVRNCVGVTSYKPQRTACVEKYTCPCIQQQTPMAMDASSTQCTSDRILCVRSARPLAHATKHSYTRRSCRKFRTRALTVAIFASWISRDSNRGLAGHNSKKCVSIYRLISMYNGSDSNTSAHTRFAKPLETRRTTPKNVDMTKTNSVGSTNEA